MSHVPPVHKVLLLVENRPAPTYARVSPVVCAWRVQGLQVSIISPTRKVTVVRNGPDARGTMGPLGRMRVEEELSWEHSKEHLLVAYGMLLSSAQSRHVRAASAQVHQQDRSVA
jgi:hypothetical protein